MKKLGKLTCFTAVLLTTFLMVSVLSGCKKKDTGDESPAKSATTEIKSTTAAKKSETNTKTTSKSSTNADTDVAKEPGDGDNQPWTDEQDDNGDAPGDGGDKVPEEEIIDLNGRTIRVATWGNPPSPESTGKALAKYYANQYVMETYNCNIEYDIYVKAQTPIEFMNAALAGVYFCDILSNNRDFAFPEMIVGNMLLDIGQYIDFENDPVWKNKNAGYWKGKYYALNVDEYYFGGNGIWYNRNMLAQEGAKEPYDFYMEGQWDWAALLDICLKVTRDINGDGITDQIGLDYQRERDLFESFVYSNGGDFFELDENNHFVFVGDKPINRRAMQFLDEMFNLYKVFKQGKSNLFKAGQAAMFQWGFNWGELGKNAGMENLGWIFFPRGPDTEEYIFYKGGGGSIVTIPANVEDPAAVVKVAAIMNAIWDPDKPFYYDTEQFVKDQCTFFLYDERDWTFYRQATINDQSWIPQLALNNITELVNAFQVNVFAPVVQNKGNVLNLLEAAKPLIQSVLDDHDPTR